MEMSCRHQDPRLDISWDVNRPVYIILQELKLEAPTTRPPETRLHPAFLMACRSSRRLRPCHPQPLPPRHWSRRPLKVLPLSGGEPPSAPPYLQGASSAHQAG